MSAGRAGEKTGCDEGGGRCDDASEMLLGALRPEFVMDRLPAGRRSDYRWFNAITVRWNDIDVFGHVNNAQYYEFFDTTVVRFLHGIADAGIAAGGTAMVVAENGCRFLREIVFTDRVTMGLRVERLGTSSVRYGLAAFLNDEDEAAADGHFVHVFLDPQSRKPAPLASMVRQHLQTIFVSQEVLA